MAVKKGLGKGLDALFESYREEIGSDNKENSKVQEIKITDIDPNPEQPRKQFDEDKINELADSIKNHGVVQPIIVRPSGNRYILIAGERRWRASRVANKTTIPAVVLDMNDKDALEISLIENLQREDLNLLKKPREYRIWLTS